MSMLTYRPEVWILEFPRCYDYVISTMLTVLGYTIPEILGKLVLCGT